MSADEVVNNLHQLYVKAPEPMRRLCNRTIFDRLYFKGTQIVGARLTHLGSVLLEDGQASTWGQVPTSNRQTEQDQDDGSDDDDGPWHNGSASSPRHLQLVTLGVGSTDSELAESVERLLNLLADPEVQETIESLYRSWHRQNRN